MRSGHCRRNRKFIMQEFCEFRVKAKYAHLLFREDEGVKLGSVRKIRLATNDECFARVGQLERELGLTRGESFFYWWHFDRAYSEKELTSAEAFRLHIPPSCEPAGEECGTLYDESTACAICGVGRTLRSELILDIARLPRGKDVAATIADELVVSSRFVNLVNACGLTGAHFQVVRDRGRFGASKAAWFQLLVQPPYVKLDVSTRTGIDPFNEDLESRHRCPLGHVAGLNLLSEVSVERGSWSGRDFCLTKECIGAKRGLLRPTPLLVVSPRVWRMFRDQQVRGASFEVAHVVDKG